MKKEYDWYKRNSKISIEEEVEPKHLLSLCNNGIGPIVIVVKFLTIFDVSKLDVAYCNNRDRQQLLNMLSDNPFITFDDAKFYDDFKRFDNFLTWIGSRKINILTIKIGAESYSNVTLTNNGLIGLSRHCASLQCLDISGSNTILHQSAGKVTDEGIIELVRQSKNLISLDIGYRKFSDTAITAVARHCSKLIKLDISGCVQITDIGITEVARNCLNLESLDIFYCNKITDNGVIEVARHCSKLLSLDIVNCSKITDKSVIEVARHLTKLESLNLRYLHITNVSMFEIVQNCTVLKRLDIGHTNVSGMGKMMIPSHLPSLKVYKRLRTLVPIQLHIHSLRL